MIPLRDIQPTLTTAWAVRIVVAINVAAFLILGSDLAAALGYGAFAYQLSGTAPHWEPSLRALGAFPPAPLELQPWRVVTHMFMHGGLLHLAGNMWFLWLFGDNVEDRLGRGRFLLLYAVSGLVALFAHVLSDPSSALPLVGASGAVAGILGAYFVLFPASRVESILPIGFLLLPLTVPARVFLGLWLLMQVLNVIGPSGTGGGVAWWAHIGGFVLGMVLARPLAPPPRVIRVEFERRRF